VWPANRLSNLVIIDVVSLGYGEFRLVTGVGKFGLVYCR
jgi:hypothetical protein